MTYLESLQHAIKRLHDLDVTHAESVPIKEPPTGEAFFDGVVEVFHGDRKVYAWSYLEGEKERFIAILHDGPIDSPRKAVQAYLASLG